MNKENKKKIVPSKDDKKNKKALHYSDDGSLDLEEGANITQSFLIKE